MMRTLGLAGVAWLTWMVAPPGMVSAQPDSTAVHMQQALDRIRALEERSRQQESDLDKLKRFKLSGYVQARWETAESANDSVRVTGAPATVTPANTQRFHIRRGRLKLTYEAGPLSQAVIYFDGNTSGSNRNVTLLEAHVTLRDPWTDDHRHQLTIGQMNVPFGWELERSSSLRELPERSRAENVLFPGERDRGVKLVNGWSRGFETVLGVFNGYGINDPVFPTADPSAAKDVTARARWSGGRLAAAVSGYRGRTTLALTGPEVEVDKTRLGADAQLDYALPRAGDGALRGELYAGENLNADSARVLVVAPTAANPVTLLRPGADPGHLATEFLGWYAMWVQNLGGRLQVAARYEEFDPNTDLDHDQFARTSLGLNWLWDGSTRLTAAYDIPKTEVFTAGGWTDPKDNLWTVQVQLKF